LSVLTIQQHVRPASIEEAFSAIGPTARPVGGGTDLMLHPPPEVTTLVDLADLALDFIEESPGGFRVGAMATMTEMLEHRGLAAHLGGLLPEMLVHVGSALLRNIATVGGHIARGRLSDVVPALLVADASICWYDGDHHEAPLADYMADEVHRVPMLITEVDIPRTTGLTAGAFVKFSRVFYDISMLNAACSLGVEDGAIAVARIAVGETPKVGALVPSAAEILIGEAPSETVFAAAAAVARETVETGDDGRAGAEYRTQLVGVGVKRALAAAADRLGGSS
jgi:carbon-monoxide dehydrogenase medium subunit